VCEGAIKYSTPPLWNSIRPAVVQQARSCLQACQFSLFSFISSQSECYFLQFTMHVPVPRAKQRKILFRVFMNA